METHRFVVATTIAISEENHWLLSRYKEGAGAKSMDAALRLLLDGGPHTVWHLMMERGDEVRRICRAHGIERLIAFGSRVKGNAHRQSDLDLAFEGDLRLNLSNLFDLDDALSEAFGVKVDLHRLGALKPRIRATVEREGVDLLA